jgi:UDPglucose 6-dehydrogenase
MRAGMGDGGACHPRDNIALRWLAKDLGVGL